MGESVLRVSPLTVMEDIGPALSRCRGLGFAVVETEDPGCVGLRAGDSYLILATVAHMARQFRPGTVERLAGRPRLTFMCGRSTGCWRGCRSRRWWSSGR